MMEACQWNKSSPTGPAEHCEGGSLPISWSSLLILFIDMCVGLLSGLWIYRLFVCSFVRFFDLCGGCTEPGKARWVFIDREGREGWGAKKAGMQIARGQMGRGKARGKEAERRAGDSTPGEARGKREKKQGRPSRIGNVRGEIV